MDCFIVDDFLTKTYKYKLPDGFCVNDMGVYFSNGKKQVRVCDKIEVIAWIDSKQGGYSSKLVRYVTTNKITKLAIIASGLFASRLWSYKIFSVLCDRGFQPFSNNRERVWLFFDYFAGVRPTNDIFFEDMSPEFIYSIGKEIPLINLKKDLKKYQRLGIFL